MKTYYLDTRTTSSGFPLVLPVDKILATVPTCDRKHFREVGRFRTRRQLRRALKRLQAAS